MFLISSVSDIVTDVCINSTWCSFTQNINDECRMYFWWCQYIWGQVKCTHSRCTYALYAFKNNVAFRYIFDCFSRTVKKLTFTPMNFRRSYKNGLSVYFRNLLWNFIHHIWKLFYFRGQFVLVDHAFNTYK